MSGFIFSLLLGATLAGPLLALLGNALRREFKLDEVAAGRGWHGYVREGGHNVEVFVRRQGG